MRVFVWMLRGIVFVALLGLAIKNGSPVDLRFYWDGVWQAPLSIVILASFVAGVAVGMTALLVPLVRQRREIGRLRREAKREG